MAILIMANDGDKPIFHDFFGATCTDSAAVPAPAAKSVGFREIGASEASPSVSVGASSGAHGPVSASSDLGSERQVGNNFEGVQFHGGKSDFSGPEISNRFSGTKRSNSDSSFMASLRDKMIQMGPDSVESARLIKMFQNEAAGDRPRRSKDDEPYFAMQYPRPASTSVILQPPIGSRPDLVVSSWDRSIPMHAGQMMHYPSRLGQFATSADKLPANRYKDASASTSLISQPAADEGSRTGIKGSGLVSIINTSSGTAEKNSSGVLPSSNRPKAFPQNIETETTNPPSRRSLTSASRQMTIFYAGQAHVFDDVHPNKADAIMALAGSTGGSWSTTYSPKSSARPLLVSEAHTPSGENEMSINNIALSHNIHGRLSVLGASNHGFGQGGRISIPASGGDQGSGPVRDNRTAVQAAEPNTEGKREVGNHVG
ncbi:protein TIFY 8-like isoform X2 [Magnolia sinica]|uniref:protein TIFY 8-like isoform X2 n=1 Tax=Magnolia sinica TaxID=86752 RepID=UPI00265A4EA9|nr:protein TIFY 8-like isoform X2 [Magnolia sinica]